MNILRRASTTAAISAAGVGIAIGGVGLAAADDSTSGQDTTAQTDSSAAARPAASSQMPGMARDHGRGHGGRGGGVELSSGLAEALGLQQSDVTAALEAVRNQREPEASAEGEARTAPTEAEREARQTEMTSALADELGVSEERVTDALTSMSADRMAKARSELADRLDTAVDDGSLTMADTKAVLKAFDAGVLGSHRQAHGGAVSDDDADTIS